MAAVIVYLAGAGFVTGTVLECAGGANMTVGAVTDPGRSACLLARGRVRGAGWLP